MPPVMRNLAGWLFLLVLFLFGPLVYLAPLSAVTLLLLLFLLTGLIAYQAGALRLGDGFRALLPFAPLVGWMFLSSLWALDSGAALSLAARLTGLFAAGGLLAWWFATLPLDRLRPGLLALAAGFTVTAAFVATDVHFGGEVIRRLHAARPEAFDLAIFYNRGATIHAALLVPLTVMLLRQGGPRGRRWVFAGVQAVFGILAILATASLSAKLALSGALVAALLIRLLPALRWAIPGLLVIGALTLPFLFPVQLDRETTCWLDNNKVSALHRIYIWNFASAQIRTHPIFGWGLDAARRIPGGDAKLVIRRCDANLEETGRIGVDSNYLPLHPHSAILQVWLELGGIGVVLGFGLVIVMLARAYAAPAWRNPASQAVFGAATLAGLSVALVSFGIWQEWFQSALFVAAAVALFTARLAESDSG